MVSKWSQGKLAGTPTHLGVNLNGPLQDALDAHVGGGAAEESAEPGSSKHKHEGLHAVGGNSDDAVATADATGVEGGRIGAGELPKRGPRHMADLSGALTDLRQGDLFVLFADLAAVVSRVAGGAVARP